VVPPDASRPRVPTGRVLSVNVGRRSARSYATADATAIDKSATAAVEVRDPGPKRGGLGSGVVGDEIGDPRHHGGRLQAVYAYPREDQQWWAERIGRPIAAGEFGENLTTEGLDTTHALVGEVWRVGTAVLRVEVPRIPCRTFAGHMRERGWVRRFTEAGRTGAYLSVTVPGRIVTGDAVLVERPDHDVDLLTLFRALTGDLDATRRVVEAAVVDAEVQADLVGTLRRRGAEMR
jgi:MOSC domain-containing protein YiiM